MALLFQQFPGTAHAAERTPSAASRRSAGDRRARRALQMPVLLAVGLICLSALVPVAAQQQIEGVGITERLGEQVPTELVFSNSEGDQVRLAEYLDGEKPVVLVLVYYNCPGLCTITLSETVRTMKQMEWTTGGPFRTLSVSFNAGEGPDLAAAKKASHIKLLGRPEAAAGWDFLTGDEQNIEKLTESVGFGYRWIEDSGQFAHDTALIVLTPDGRISRYLRGATYDPETLRLALVEASDGQIGSVADRAWVKLCGYDPRYGKYVVGAMTVMKIGGGLTILVIAAVLVGFWVHERRRKRRVGDTIDHQGAPAHA